MCEARKELRWYEEYVWSMCVVCVWALVREVCVWAVVREVCVEHIVSCGGTRSMRGYVCVEYVCVE